MIKSIYFKLKFYVLIVYNKATYFLIFVDYTKYGGKTRQKAFSD